MRRKPRKIDTIGLVKIKFSKDIAYSGFLLYDSVNQKIKDFYFHSFKPIFTEYLPSALFLNQTEIYLNLINNLVTTPDCYILNSSGQIHPYLYGTACDVGLQLKVPVIGYTKSLLFGQLDENSNEIEFPGIYTRNRLIGYAIPKLRTKKYYYVSVGNNTSLKMALKVFLKLEANIISRLHVELNNFIQSFQNKVVAEKKRRSS